MGTCGPSSVASGLLEAVSFPANDGTPPNNSSGRRCAPQLVRNVIWCELASHWRTEVFSWRQMKKAKKKSIAERQISYQNPVLRSGAFARALTDAKLRIVGSGGLRSLFEQAAKEAASLPRQRFKENWPYLQT